ncbi:hypothetical protein FEM48_Zijuj05G0145900 [Ziziphus jujuba var. spinosa]|uniref:Protein EMBRYO DEFECTIVE 514 n=1 Tax=Ziziphus jujuba var. spinosa TaxID=714518 RepID=A0A978VFD8_ZIZJJ|nr:hypothetical protein FEM48_Zijuj05G0145900 [Ziziphus jujuba var. spinosa]
MAEETVAELLNTNLEGADVPGEDMELETLENGQEDTKGDGDGGSGAVANGAEPPANGEANSKRAREEEEEEEEEENNGVSKKQKVEKSVEEDRLEKLGGGGSGGKEGENGDDGSVRVKLGPKEFVSSVEMFDYFFKLLHFWPPNVNINKYEQMVLLDLLKKGHAEPDKKIGGGIKAFQVRFHPTFKSRCFFLLRNDETTDDFSFRKCVDRILPLPEHMQIKSDANRGLSGGGGKGRGGRGGGRGRGRGGKSRN